MRTERKKERPTETVLTLKSVDNIFYTVVVTWFVAWLVISHNVTVMVQIRGNNLGSREWDVAVAAEQTTAQRIVRATSLR